MNKILFIELTINRHCLTPFNRLVVSALARKEEALKRLLQAERFSTSSYRS